MLLVVCQVNPARSSDITERPYDALHQLKSCQLQHHCTKIMF